MDEYENWGKVSLSKKRLNETNSMKIENFNKGTISKMDFSVLSYDYDKRI
jgi:hypothetical protein